MAKKVRTPPPPRRVQAPQRRDHRRPPSPGAPQRSPWLYAVGGALVVAVIAAAVLGVVLTRGGGNGKAETSKVAAYNTLPGIRQTKAPWPPEYRYLADRLAPLGLTTLAGHSGLVEHYHAHLDIFVDGKKVKVPALIGINPGAGYLTELHTHDARGVVHIEATDTRNFNLGQFVAEWAVFLNSNQIGAYKGLKWYVNGQLQTGNPQDLVLKSHQEIAIVIGKPPANIPSSYAFSPGE